MKDSEQDDGIVVANVLINQHVGKHDRDAHVRAQRGTRRAHSRDVGEPLDRGSKSTAELFRDTRSCFRSQMFKDVTGVVFGISRDDQLRHQERRTASFSSSRLKYSSPEVT